jgi:hypothetical protein
MDGARGRLVVVDSHSHVLKNNINRLKFATQIVLLVAHPIMAPKSRSTVTRTAISALIPIRVAPYVPKKSGLKRSLGKMSFQSR